MPCRTDDWDLSDRLDLHDENRELRLKVSMLEPMLCATMELLREEYMSFQQVYGLLNYTEVGVNKTDFVAWHTAHVEQDQIRREREREQRYIAELKASALSKLTEEEKAVLGIK